MIIMVSYWFQIYIAWDVPFIQSHFSHGKYGDEVSYRFALAPVRRRTVGSVIHHAIATWKLWRPPSSQVYQEICR